MTHEQPPGQPRAVVPRTLRVAVTGGIGSGKSQVSGRLAAHGAIVVDADRIAREIVEPGQPALAEIADAFGPGVIAADGRLDRPALAAVVFSDPAALARLNAITHPRIGDRARQLLDGAPAGSVLVYDMPLLVEQGQTEGWDLVVVLDCPDDVRLARLVGGRGMDPADASARMAAQATREQRLAVADVVLDNSGTLAELQGQVDALWEGLRIGAAAGTEQGAGQRLAL